MNGRQRRFYLVQAVTLGRIPLVMAFLAVNVFAPKPLAAAWFTTALVLLIVAAASDLFDGLLARKLGVTSRLGAHFDPLCDKMFYLAAFPTLVYLAALRGDRLHAGVLLGLTVVFLIRDQWVTFLRGVGAVHRVDGRANWSGKLRTLIAFPVVCAVFYALEAPADWRLRVPRGAALGLECVALAVNLVSVFVYTRRYWPWLRKECRATDDPAARDDK